MYGSEIGFLHIDILDSSLSILESDIISAITDNVNAWQQSPIIDLSPYIPQGTIHIQFRSRHSGNGFHGDMAIDNITIQEINPIIFNDSFEQLTN